MNPGSMALHHGRKPASGASARAAKAQQKTPPPEGSGVFIFMTCKEEIPLSLAGLAVTYSPRA
jgi:hypothetical protein